MKQTAIKAAACAALAAALIGGAILACADKPAQATEARTVRAQESGFCVIPGREIAREDEDNGQPRASAPTEEEPELVMIERDLRVEIPLIRGCVPAPNEAQEATPSVASGDSTHETREERACSAVGEGASAEPAMRYLGQFKITGYDTCARCCGKTDGITASGTQATVGRTCAASKDLPFGTRLYIEGIGERIVEDRGGGVNGSHIDVLVADHPAAYAITGYYAVFILED